MWSVWIPILLFILSSAAGENPIQPTVQIHMVQLAFIPEGWSFFTRNARESWLIVYRREGAKLKALSFSNASRQNAFGLSRAARAFHSEVAGLLTPVLRSSWSEWQGDPAEYDPGGRRPSLELKNWSRTRYVCGDVIVVSAPPVPWAWSRSRTRLRMPSKVLKLKVDCGQQMPISYR